MAELQREELQALLGAYALDAVDDDEREQIERYLETDPRRAPRSSRSARRPRCWPCRVPTRHRASGTESSARSTARSTASRAATRRPDRRRARSSGRNRRASRRAVGRAALGRGRGRDRRDPDRRALRAGAPPERPDRPARRGVDRRRGSARRGRTQYGAREPHGEPHVRRRRRAREHRVARRRDRLLRVPRVGGSTRRRRVPTLGARRRRRAARGDLGRCARQRAPRRELPVLRSGQRVRGHPGAGARRDLLAPEARAARAWSRPERARLDARRATMGDAPLQPLGVYVHVPFCSHRCDYCDFATWTDREPPDRQRTSTRASPTSSASSPTTSRPVTTVFFGGGTPSLLEPDALARIIGAIPTAPGAEVTVECNPDSVDPAKLDGYRPRGRTESRSGCSRWRPGPRRARPDPRPGQRRQGGHLGARDAGFERLNVDVIYGAAGESLDDWRRTVDGVDRPRTGPHQRVRADRRPVDPARSTDRRRCDPAARRRRSGDEVRGRRLRVRRRGVRVVRDLELGAARARSAGTTSSTGSRVTTSAIGCAAHGHRDGERWWNVRTPERYIEAIDAAASPRAGAEHLDALTRAEEAFGLALRTRFGAVVAPRRTRRPPTSSAGGILEPVGRGSGLEARRVVLTRAGRLLGDDVTARLLLAGAVGPAVASDGPAPRRPDPAGTR